MNTRMMFAWVAADGAGEEGISRAEVRVKAVERKV